MKLAVVTGGARRIGAAICRELHRRGYAILLHHHASTQAAADLASELNAIRADSVESYAADLLDHVAVSGIADFAVQRFGRIDLLVNNASSFYPTPLHSISDQAWADLMGTNARAPLALSAAAAPHLKRTGGSIINITDINIERPTPGYIVYSMAKAALAALTYGLAKELAPDVRVNGVAPGSNIWPDAGDQFATEERARILSHIPLQRTGTPEEIAQVVGFLADDASYVTGQIIAVDGGRSRF